MFKKVYNRSFFAQVVVYYNLSLLFCSSELSRFMLEMKEAALSFDAEAQINCFGFGKKLTLNCFIALQFVCALVLKICVV